MSNADGELPLIIGDLQAGLAYLSGLVLDDPETADRQLTRLLDTLLAMPPEPGSLFALLERTREPLAFAEAEIARRYHSKPVPLDAEEEAAFEQCVDAWRKMAAAYGRCLPPSDGDAGGPQFLMRLATVLQRCLYYTGMVILEHYRARRELPPGIWLDLHRHYRLAEAHGIAYLAVDDPLEADAPQVHCAAAYLVPLLTEIASPYSHDPREVNLIRSWAAMAAPLVLIAPQRDDRELPAYVIELAKDAPLHPVVNAGEMGDDVRCIDSAHLGVRIGQLLTLLHQRVPPQQLGLGDETSGKTIELLEQLRHAWGLEILPRRFRRFPAVGSAQVVAGFPGMYVHISGEDFEQPDSATTYSRGEFDQLFTFREQSDPGMHLAFKPKTSFPPDEWTVLNHSASGFRLLRAAAGEALRHGQLLALKPHDGERYILVAVTWLMQERSGQLEAGVATLPGVPEGVGVRILIPGTPGDERFVSAFLLPAVPAIHEEASVVLPVGIYQASRELEVVHGDGRVSQLQMNHILQRGCDFDRVSYRSL